MRLSPKRMRARLGEKVDRAAAGSPVPAGAERPVAGEESRTSARERGAMRRRARRLRRSREALLLELGALVFESERRGRRDQNLVKTKVDRLRDVDDEARALAAALGEDRPMVDLVTAGVAGSCERCGSLVSTDARFCSNCGTPTSARGRREAAARDGTGSAPTGAAAETAGNGAPAGAPSPSAAAGDRTTGPAGGEALPQSRPDHR